MRKWSGFGFTGILLVLFVLGVAGYAGWYVWNKNKKDSIGVDKTATSQYSSTNTAGKSTYNNEAIGLKFTYPSRWGSAVTKTRNDTDRSVPANGYSEFDITFPNVPLFILPILNNKNSYLVQFAGCFNALGFLNYARSQAADQLKPGGWKQSETASGNSYTTYDKILDNNSKTLIIESFAVSTIVNPQSYCNGLSVYGLKEVSNNSKGLSQVQFLWSKTASTFGKDQPELDLRDLDDFKNNPTKYISEEDLSDLQTTVRSIVAY